ncbi:MAG: AI-2E family transporter [Acidobacteria bacterium]|nr:AI-2E family transporter [Acidobacteriota bacterium]
MASHRTGAERFRALLFYGVVPLLGYLAFLVTRPFLAPLAWASVLAMTLYPLHQRLGTRLSPSHAALATTLTAALLIVAPLALLGMMLSSELPRVMAYAQQIPAQATPENIERLWDELRQYVPFTLPDDSSQILGQAVQTVGGFLGPRLGSAVASVFEVVGSLFVTLFALFFLLRDARRLSEGVRRLLPFPPHERELLITEAHDLVIASVGAGLTVSAVQGLVGGLAFWALGLGAPAIWGVLVAVCSLLPVVGAALVWAPVAFWLGMSGAVGQALALVIVGTLGISMVDNVLRPILLSGRSSVNGLIVFIGLLGGTTAFGLVGLVFGPIILVLAGTLFEALTRHSSSPTQRA